MRLNVTSEIGRLRRVMVHLPGREIDTMIPSMMEELLFDDILYGQAAREEHRRFQQILWYVADEVVDLQTLLGELLEDDDAREIVLKDVLRRYPLRKRATDTLRELEGLALAEKLIGGIVSEDRKETDPVFELPPVPNLFFTRDPQVVIGSSVAISSMATRARERESLLSHYVFTLHPAFRSGSVVLADRFSGSRRVDEREARRLGTIEGGDVLVARRDLLMIGVSERTNRAGVENLATALRNSGSEIRTVLLVEIPRQRSYMHLDTVFTFISQDECLVYPPVVLAGGRWEANVYEIDLTKGQLTYTAQKSLLDALRARGLDFKPIPCGGDQRIDQEREQWTDGANAFAMAPGLILLYERNVHTAEELARNGYHIVYEDDLLLGREELDLKSKSKYAIQIQGHELSRARGGPRCMTMPLDRDEM